MGNFCEFSILYLHIVSHMNKKNNYKNILNLNISHYAPNSTGKTFIALTYVRRYNNLPTCVIQGLQVLQISISI